MAITSGILPAKVTLEWVEGLGPTDLLLARTDAAVVLRSIELDIDRQLAERPGPLPEGSLRPAYRKARVMASVIEHCNRLLGAPPLSQPGASGIGHYVVLGRERLEELAEEAVGSMTEASRDGDDDRVDVVGREYTRIAHALHLLEPIEGQPEGAE